MINQLKENDFKNVMSRFATGVTVVTILSKNGDKYGITINSFSSLSLKPQLIQFNIAKGSSIFNSFENNNKFTVNILTQEQHKLCNAFAKPRMVDWSLISHDINSEGYLSLSDVVATIMCQKWQQYDGGDHIIYIGEVSSLSYDQNKNPLVYYNRKLHSLKI